MCYKETYCGYSSGRAECDFRAHAMHNLGDGRESLFSFFPLRNQCLRVAFIRFLAWVLFLFTNWHRNHARPPTGQARRLRRHRSASPPFPAALVMMGGGGGGMAGYGDKAREIRGGRGRKRAHLACADRCEKEFLLSRKCLGR